MKISRDLVPPGGWEYKQGQFIIEGETFNELVQNVTHHREANAIFIGNVSKDIEDQIASKHPHLIISHGS